MVVLVLVLVPVLVLVLVLVGAASPAHLQSNIPAGIEQPRSRLRGSLTWHEHEHEHEHEYLDEHGAVTNLRGAVLSTPHAWMPSPAVAIERCYRFGRHGLTSACSG